MPPVRIKTPKGGRPKLVYIYMIVGQNPPFFREGFVRFFIWHAFPLNFNHYLKTDKTPSYFRSQRQNGQKTQGGFVRSH